MLKLPIQVCYVLTDNDQGIYANLNLLSIWSLRQSNPNAYINLLCDKHTRKTLKKNRHQILDNIDKIISVDTPNGTAGYRNRYIKTSMRRYLRGAFLYLDADTLIRGDLNPLFLSTASFSAAPNHSGTGEASEIPESELAPFHQMNWPIPQKYVNGGVLYFSDHPEVYGFAELWHQKWLDCSVRTGKHYDQHSLNSALNDSCIKFEWMSHRYNAQVHARPNTAWGAVVWHIYLSGQHASPKTLFDFVLANLDQYKFDRSDILDALVQRDHPWLIDNIIDRFAVKRIRHRNQILGPRRWERLWLADDYLGAIKSAIRTVRLRTNRLLVFRK